MTKARLWMIGGPVLALGLWLLGAGSSVTAADDDLVKEVLKLADAVAKKDANAQKAADALGKKNETDAVMELFKPRGKGNGLGVGPKAGVVKADGIEKKIQEMDKKPMTAASIQAEGDAIANMANVTVVIADMIHSNPPKEGKKKEKEWQKFTEEMKKSSVELADAVKAAKADPMKIQKTAQKLNNACIGCHDAFR